VVDVTENFRAKLAWNVQIDGTVLATARRAEIRDSKNNV
jgi:hypothetical protein